MYKFLGIIPKNFLLLIQLLLFPLFPAPAILCAGFMLHNMHKKEDRLSGPPWFSIVPGLN